MEYQADYRGMGEFLRGPDARRICTLAAAAVLAKARVLADKDKASGDTARSGHLLHGTGGRKQDRVKVSVVFRGEVLAMQFGNKRRKATRFLTRAFE